MYLGALQIQTKIFILPYEISHHPFLAKVRECIDWLWEIVRGKKEILFSIQSVLLLKYTDSNFIVSRIMNGMIYYCPINQGCHHMHGHRKVWNSGGGARSNINLRLENLGRHNSSVLLLIYHNLGPKSAPPFLRPWHAKTNLSFPCKISCKSINGQSGLWKTLQWNWKGFL